MPNIDLAAIVINPDRRQRREFDEAKHQELMTSMSSPRGQLQPIIIDRDTGELLAGERRYRAAQGLGWTSIECKYVQDLDEGERMLIQYDENIRRDDLDWKSKALAIHEYHEYMSATYSEWTSAATAAALNMSGASLSQYLGVASELEDGNDMVESADTFSVARGIVERKRSREADSALDQFLTPTPASAVEPSKTSPTTAATHGGDEALAERVEEEPVQHPGVPFLHADFNSWQAEYKGPKYNLLHCDFPYGIDTDKHDSSAQGFGDYADTPEVYFQLLDTLERAMNNVVAESAHLIFWFSMDFYQETIDRLEAMGWRVNHFPLIWHKTNRSILPDPKRGPRRQYETALLASRGDRLIVRATTNVYSGPATKEVHKSEKPRDMLAHFLGMVCDETSTLLDPTMGSGNAVAVAEEYGALALGLERDRIFFENASTHYRRNLSQG